MNVIDLGRWEPSAAAPQNWNMQASAHLKKHINPPGKGQGLCASLYKSGLCKTGSPYSS